MFYFIFHFLSIQLVFYSVITCCHDLVITVLRFDSFRSIEPVGFIFKQISRRMMSGCGISINNHHDLVI